MIVITCTYNKLTRDNGTCKIDGAKSYKQAHYATAGKPNYPVPAPLELPLTLSTALWIRGKLSTKKWLILSFNKHNYYLG